MNSVEVLAGGGLRFRGRSRGVRVLVEDDPSYRLHEPFRGTLDVVGDPPSAELALVQLLQDEGWQVTGLGRDG
jgi:hypothetical protein